MLSTNTQTPQTTEQKHNKTQLQLHAQHKTNNSKPQQSNTGQKQHTYHYTKTCNCQKNKTCPLDGQCQTKSIIYQATVTRHDNNKEETYVGLTENTFKS